MSELISGKDALIALGTDESIQFRRNMDWNDFDLNNTFGLKISDFKDPNIQFRIKPKKITLNGIEVPAPFKPKDGDEFYYLNDEYACGYSSWSAIGHAFIATWRTEDEIKQVVKALRSIFK